MAICKDCLEDCEEFQECSECGAEMCISCCNKSKEQPPICYLCREDNEAERSDN